jgi:hypothetical protein
MDQLRELMGLGSLTVDTDPNLKRYDMWYLLARYEGQNLADLKRLAVYSIIYPASQSAVLICRNTPADLKRRIEQFNSTDELCRNPFLLHVLITDWVISVIRQRWLLYDSKVMELKGKNSTTYEFFELAKTQRHLEELILTIQTLSSQQKLVYDADTNLRSRVERGFSSHLLQCSLLKSRLTSIQQLGKDIVQNTLNFATFEIAKNSQRDSTTMKAIAVITMLTLPGVFVSAILGMSFFSTQLDSNNQTRLVVSNKWWIFFAITTPLTIGIIIFWWVLIRGERKSGQQSVV